MTENLLYHVAKAAEDAERAWLAASINGSHVVQSALQSLHTLESYRNPNMPSPPPNHLLTHQEDYERNLGQLRATIRRLQSILKSLARWRNEVGEWSQSEALIYKFERFLSGLKMDLDRKTDVINVVSGMTLSFLSEREWTKCTAQWTEQPDRIGQSGETLAAMARAQQCLDDAITRNADGESPLIGENLLSPPRNTKSSESRSESVQPASPALLALKNRLAGHR